MKPNPDLYMSHANCTRYQRRVYRNQIFSNLLSVIKCLNMMQEYLGEHWISYLIPTQEINVDNLDIKTVI
jgi:hypothetical protein